MAIKNSMSPGMVTDDFRPTMAPQGFMAGGLPPTMAPTAKGPDSFQPMMREPLPPQMSGGLPPMGMPQAGARDYSQPMMRTGGTFSATPAGMSGGYPPAGMGQGGGTDYRAMLNALRQGVATGQTPGFDFLGGMRVSGGGYLANLQPSGMVNRVGTGTGGGTGGGTTPPTGGWTNPPPGSNGGGFSPGNNTRPPMGTGGYSGGSGNGPGTSGGVEQNIFGPGGAFGSGAPNWRPPTSWGGGWGGSGSSWGSGSGAGGNTGAGGSWMDRIRNSQLYGNISQRLPNSGRDFANLGVNGFAASIFGPLGGQGANAIFDRMFPDDPRYSTQGPYRPGYSLPGGFVPVQPGQQPPPPDAGQDYRDALAGLQQRYSPNVRPQSGYGTNVNASGSYRNPGGGFTQSVMRPEDVGPYMGAGGPSGDEARAMIERMFGRQIR